MMTLVLKHREEAPFKTIAKYTRDKLLECPYYAIRSLFYAFEEVHEWEVQIQNYDPEVRVDGTIPSIIYDSNYTLDMLVTEIGGGVDLERLNYVRVRMFKGSLHYIGYSLISNKFKRVPMSDVQLVNSEGLPPDVFVRFAQLRGLLASSGWPATSELMDEFLLARVTNSGVLRNLMVDKSYELVMGTQKVINQKRMLHDVSVLALKPSECTFNITPQTTPNSILVMEKDGNLTISTVTPEIEFKEIVAYKDIVGVHGEGMERKVRTLKTLVNDGMTPKEANTINWN